MQISAQDIRTYSFSSPLSFFFFLFFIFVFWILCLFLRKCLSVQYSWYQTYKTLSYSFMRVSITGVFHHTSLPESHMLSMYNEPFLSNIIIHELFLSRCLPSRIFCPFHVSLQVPALQCPSAKSPINSELFIQNHFVPTVISSGIQRGDKHQMDRILDSGCSLSLCVCVSM